MVALYLPPRFRGIVMSRDRLTLNELVLIGEAVLGIDGRRLLSTIDLGSAESALAAPFAGTAAAERYPEVATKAAILCSRLIRNHPFPDGNKRIAHVAMRELLARHGYEWIRPPDDEAEETIDRLAAREIAESEFTDWAAQHVRPTFTKT
jgi:death on curing protein